MILEQVISNEKIIMRHQEPIIRSVLPFLVTRFDVKSDEARFTLVKSLADLLGQLFNDEITSENRGLLITFLSKSIFPTLKKLIAEKNPIGLTGIKLLRLMLDFETGLRDLVFTYDLYKGMMGYFASTCLVMQSTTKSAMPAPSK
jgi:hypothetical protein